MSSAGELRSQAGADRNELQPRRSRAELTLVGAMNVALRHRASIAATSVGVALVTALLLLLGHRTYTSASSFIPQSRRAAQSLSGLAAQFGLFVPGADASESPGFYADLVTTREILGAVADSRYQFRSDTGMTTATLVQLYGKGAKTSALGRDAAIRRLAKTVAANVALATGVVELRVNSRYADLSQEINERILGLVNDFNMEKRQTQAASERRFTEQRLDEVRTDLRGAEDKLQAFLQRNRDYRNSPELTFEEDRLARDIAMQQQIYTTLAQAYEQAKIEQVRDTPVITVIAQAEVPVRPDSRGVVKGTVLGLLAGGLLGLIVAFGRNAVATGQVGSGDELSQFSLLLQNLRRDLRHPWRAVFGLGRGRDRNQVAS